MFARKGDAALLSAKYPMEYIEVNPMDEQKLTHYRPTKAHISLSALGHNVKELKKLIGDSKIAAVVKANAYGHGILRISEALCELPVDMLCVATPDEAIYLRENGITKPILLLSEPTIEAVGPCYQNNITFTVYSMEIIKVIAAHSTIENKAHVHLKIDTGMNRVGVKASDALMIAKYIHNHETLNFEGLYTHFALADEPSNPVTSQQLERFENVLDEIEMAGLTPPIIHAANSPASIRFPSSRFSMCRIGLCLYGIYPEPKCTEYIELKNVMTLTTNIAYLKTIDVGESVSYGARFVADKQTKIATLPVGYGDGVPRNLGISGGTVLIHGVRWPIVGNVTMDQTMVDVGSAPVAIGDKVTLLGSDGSTVITQTEWADLTGTNAYEVCTGISERVYRQYD